MARYLALRTAVDLRIAALRGLSSISLRSSSVQYMMYSDLINCLTTLNACKVTAASVEPEIESTPAGAPFTSVRSDQDESG